MADEIRRDEARIDDSLRNRARSTGAPGRLAPLDDLQDFKVADTDPDIRGWDVELADGQKIGEVHDLIIDTTAMKARYLDVDIDNDVLDTEDDRHILVPVGCATLNGNADEVRLTGIDIDTLRTIPAFQHEAITRDFETRIRGCYPAESAPVAAPAAQRETEDDFYGHQHFDEDRLLENRRQGREQAQYITRSEEELSVGTRQVQAGEVEVRKHVETEHVRQQVPTMREEVTVERRPARPGMSANPTMEEGEIRIPVMEEEAVVEKRVVPKEEVVVEKHAVQGEQTVEADLRKERVDVDREGKSRKGKRS